MLYMFSETSDAGSALYPSKRSGDERLPFGEKGWS
jgi:hypothetical protein